MSSVVLMCWWLYLLLKICWCVNNWHLVSFYFGLFYNLCSVTVFVFCSRVSSTVIISSSGYCPGETHIISCWLKLAVKAAAASEGQAAVMRVCCRGQSHKSEARDKTLIFILSVCHQLMSCCCWEGPEINLFRFNWFRFIWLGSTHMFSLCPLNFQVTEALNSAVCQMNFNEQTDNVQFVSERKHSELFMHLTLQSCCSLVCESIHRGLFHIQEMLLVRLWLHFQIHLIHLGPDRQGEAGGMQEGGRGRQGRQGRQRVNTVVSL